MSNHLRTKRKCLLKPLTRIVKRLSIVTLAFCILGGNAQASQKNKQKKRIRVSCIGNSVTYGVGVQDPVKDSYPSQLQQLLGDEYEVGRFGKPGARLLRQTSLPYFDQIEFRQAMDFHGDVAIIHLGLNDTDPGAWPNHRDHFVQDYCDLVDSIRKSNPSCRVILAQLTPIGDRHSRFLSGTRDWHAMIQKEIARVAEEKDCELMTFFDSLHCRLDVFPDALHPNKEGYNIMARQAYSFITGDYGGLRLPLAFTSNMVLPRNRQFPLQGMANAGEKVSIEIAGQKHSTFANKRGQWSITLKPLAQGGPYTLRVKAPSRTVELTNILAGEVWLASGQSNMAFELKHAIQGQDLAQTATNNDIRLFNQKPRWFTDNVEWSQEALESINQLQYYHPAQWEVCSPGLAADFSAIALIFAKELRDSLQCPIGIVCNAVGGSGIEAWIDRTTVEWNMPELLRDWTNNDFIQAWVRERAKKNMQQSQNKLQRHPYQPCYLYESSIQQLQSLPINGILWYQGESNAHCMESHERMFTLLQQSWRNTWQDENLPFLFVQLSSLNRPSWPWFRDSQRRLAQKQPATWMAVSSDCGDSLDVHPRQKAPIAHRLTLLALRNVYGHQSTLANGPQPIEANFESKEIVLTMQDAEGMQPSNGQDIIGFEIAHTDGLFLPAKVKIVGNRLHISNDQIKNPRYVRYGWQPFTRANLINRSGLPASTFRMQQSNVDKR